MNEVEKYLKKATRGLWGSKKREVREELATHIEGRVQAHRIGGLDEETAVQRTLSELGKPAQVSGGMMTLHTMPSLMGLGALLSTALVLSITLISGGMAQSVPGTFYWPSKECVDAFQKGTVSSSPFQDFMNKVFNDDCLQADNSLWLNFDTLRLIFEEAGIKTDEGKRVVGLQFPNGENIAFPLGSPNVSVMGEDDKPIPVEQGYFDLWELVKAVALKSNIPLSFEGWDNPTVHIGDASFQVGTPEQPFQGDDFYENYLENVLFTVAGPVSGNYVQLVNPRIRRLAKSEGLESFNWDESYVAPGKARLDTEPTSGIYGLIVLLDLQSPQGHKFTDDDQPDTALYMSLARANPDGSINLELPSQEKIHFVNTFHSLSRPGDAMLVELGASAGSWFKGVAPEQIGLER